MSYAAGLRFTFPMHPNQIVAWLTCRRALPRVQLQGPEHAATLVRLHDIYMTLRPSRAVPAGHAGPMAPLLQLLMPGTVPPGMTLMVLELAMYASIKGTFKLEQWLTGEVLFTQVYTYISQDKEACRVCSCSPSG